VYNGHDVYIILFDCGSHLEYCELNQILSNLIKLTKRILITARKKQFC